MRIGSPPAGYALIAALAALACANHASAQDPDCASLGDHIIYGVGGSAQTPLIGEIASRLRAPANPDDTLTIVYAEPGACYAPAAFDTTKPEAERYITTFPKSATARYWNQGDIAPKNCVLSTTQLADFGSMQTYVETCPDYEAAPEGLGDFKGPVGTVNFIVPTDSSENSISAEALYYLFKFGPDAGIEPWTDLDYLTRRAPSSAVQLLVVKAAGLLEETSGEIPFGWDAGSNSVSVGTVANSGVHAMTPTADAVTVPNTQATWGFVSGENYEKNRSTLRTLAYQHTDQECAYWPDSSENASDKINVRIGRYFLWSSLHLYAPVSGTANDLDDVENPDVKRLIGYFTGEIDPPAGLPITDIYIDNYNVPDCAMQVSRDEDLGALSSYQPDEPCGCYFEDRATGRTDCASCDEDTDCPSSSPKCRLGFCEVQ